MATTSFDKNIVIKNKKAEAAFKKALIKSEVKETLTIDVVKELKGSCSKLKRKYSR